MPRNEKKSRKMPSSKLRIIGGKWGSRKLPILEQQAGLRPTGDRIRETLFNWLAPYIQNARCLDLFCGSGALGLEALSRGARHAQFIDNNPKAIEQINTNIETLEARGAQVDCRDALDWLANEPASPFNIIFIDPPFALNLWPDTLQQLNQHQSWLEKGSLIYIEKPTQQGLPIPASWQQHKHKTTGNVSYSLYRFMPELN